MGPDKHQASCTARDKSETITKKSTSHKVSASEKDYVGEKCF